MPTIKDVAKLAGVGVGTVSNYINGIPVRESNRVKIEAAIKELDFKANAIARSLKTSRTRTIGVVISHLQDIYSATIINSVEYKLSQAGYNTLICNSRGSSKLEKEKIEALVERMVDGLIIYPCNEDISYLNNVLNGKVPVVTIDNKTINYPCDQVLTDNASATYKAVEWLINSNHRRIAIIRPSSHFTMRERLLGYERAHHDYSINIDPDLIKTIDSHGRETYDAVNEIKALMNISSPPTALITCNYYSTIEAYKAICDLKINIPNDLSFIGFDNIGLTELIRPSLSIIVQPMEEMGATAAALILKRINGDLSGFPSILRLKPELIIRESTKRL